jgi:hypothetical protein
MSLKKFSEFVSDKNIITPNKSNEAKTSEIKEELDDKVDVKGSTMKLVHSDDKYDFYIGVDEKGENFYNVVPSGSNKPNSGYYKPEWICKIKGVENIFKKLNKKDNILENISFINKVAKFPKDFKPSETYKILESKKVIKEKLHYIITEQQENVLVVLKYNEKVGPNLKEFVSSLLEYFNKSKFSNLTENVKVEGSGVFAIIKNIPNKECMDLLNKQITNLLNDFKNI